MLPCPFCLSPTLLLALPCLLLRDFLLGRLFLRRLGALRRLLHRLRLRLLRLARRPVRRSFSGGGSLGGGGGRLLGSSLLRNVLQRESTDHGGDDADRGLDRRLRRRVLLRRLARRSLGGGGVQRVHGEHRAL